MTSPGPATNSVPSSILIASLPATWYWKWGASQLLVFAIGFTSFDQRQPGWKTSRPTSAAADLQDLGAAVGELADLVGSRRTTCARCRCVPPRHGTPRSASGRPYHLVGRPSTRGRLAPDAPRPPPRPARGRPTADRVLDVAERLVQTRGFNGFSYADVPPRSASRPRASTTTSPARPTSAARWSSATRSGSASALGGDRRARRRRRRAARRLREALRRRARRDRMCLCGMLAAEYETLPAPVQRAIRALLRRERAWLAASSSAAARRGDARLLRARPRRGAPVDRRALEGAMLLSRSYGDASRFEAAARGLLAGFAPA